MGKKPAFLGMGRDPLYISINSGKAESKGGKKVFPKGAPQLTNFTIENRSDDFIVIRKIEIDGQLPDIDRWFGPRYGSVEYREEKNVFFYNVVEQCLSEPVFAMGLIRPNGKIDVTRMVALRGSPVNFEVYYQRISLGDAKERLYFNFPDEPEIGPKRIFRSIDDFNLFVSESRTDSVDWSTVILKGENKLPFQRQALSLPVILEESPFSLKKALEKFGFKIADYVFWTSENCWVFKRDKNLFIVGENRIVKLGNIDLAVFTLIELSPDKTGFILPLEGYEDFNPKRPKIEGPGYFNPGITHIPRNKVFRLFQYATRRGDGIKIIVYDPHGLGRRFYISVGEFKEKERRAYAVGEAH
jgi:hypothetical protein